jgi:signal transduction histidine kinase
MAEADFGPEYELTEFNRSTDNPGSPYLKSKIDEQRERQRLFDIFHDGIVKKLVGVHLGIDLLKDADSIAPELGQLRELVRSAIESAHTLADEIAPHVLSRIGFEAALRELFRKYADNYGLACYIDISNADTSLFDEKTGLVLFDLVKRLLAGAVVSRHADTVRMAMQTVDSTIEIMMQDNGCLVDGLEEIIATGRYRKQDFLLEAAEQVYSLGGRVWIDGSGDTRTVCVAVPLTFADAL